MVDRQFVAMKAFVEHDGDVLVLRESTAYDDGSNAGRYNLVGGRVEPGEAPMESLHREIDEETGLSVTVLEPLHVRDWRPVVDGEKWQIVATFFRCRATSRAVELSQDHDDYRWIDPAAHTEVGIVPGSGQDFERYLDARRDG